MLRGKYYISRLVKEPVPDKRPAIQNMVQLLLAMVSRATNDIDHAPKIKLENKKKKIKEEVDQLIVSITTCNWNFLK